MIPPHKLCYMCVQFSHHTHFPPPKPAPPHTYSIIYLTIGGDDNCLDCTPDELAALVREIRDNSALIGTHTYRLVSYKNTIVGHQLVDWLIAKKGYKSNYFDTTVCLACSIKSSILTIRVEPLTKDSLLRTQYKKNLY